MVSRCNGCNRIFSWELAFHYPVLPEVDIKFVLFKISADIVPEPTIFKAVLREFWNAELCGDMKQENWLLCHVHAYAYFDGVTRLLIPDNLKTGVTKNTRYETVLNRSYQELAEHYGTAIVPARVEHPKDNSHAEGTVRYASTWILAALRDERFFSLSEA